MNRHEPFLAAVGQHWGSWIKHQCETRHEHQRKGHLPTPAVELPRLLPVAATGLSTVSSGTQETSCHLREPVWVPFVTACSLDGHMWATQSTCFEKWDSPTVFTMTVLSEEKEDGAKCSDSTTKSLSWLPSPWPALASSTPPHRPAAETRDRGYISHISSSDINRSFSTGLYVSKLLQSVTFTTVIYFCRSPVPYICFCSSCSSSIIGRE